MSDLLQTLDEGPIRTLRLARPPVNALNPELCRALIAALAAAHADDVHGLVLAGGAGIFTGGLDVPYLMSLGEDRDALLQHCLDAGIEAKVHYPIPLYQQEGLRHFGYKAGDFPVTDRHTREIITFPTDQHLSREQQDYVIETVRRFYASR